MITPHEAIADVAAVAAHYDDLDLFYRTIWGPHIHHGYWKTGKENRQEAVLNLTRLVAEQAGVQAGDRVCDLGCGYGATALVLAREYQGKVTALTVSRRQYEFARSRNANPVDVDFFLRDALDNQLEAESFDRVISIESSEHMKDKLAFLTEVNRLLRPGGRFVLTAWLTREQPAPWESRYLLQPICVEGRLPNLASASEYQDMLSRAGLGEIVFQDLTRHVQKTWTICTARFVGKAITEPSLRSQLFDPNFSNRVFAKAVFRIWLAYKTGSMRYGLFSAQK
jgi:cyclopropane fatty-acyl-phospholipid synthase-like methyltransferase